LEEASVTGKRAVAFFRAEVTSVLKLEVALIMVAVQTSETVVNLHQSTRRYNPEDSHLQNMYIYICVFFYVCERERETW
jgi:hypothetical protein